MCLIAGVEMERFAKNSGGYGFSLFTANLLHVAIHQKADA
jgi:hypothetical protein